MRRELWFGGLMIAGEAPTVTSQSANAMPFAKVVSML